MGSQSSTSIFFSTRGIEFLVFFLPKGPRCLRKLGVRRKGGWHCYRSKAGQSHYVG